MKCRTARPGAEEGEGDVALEGARYCRVVDRKHDVLFNDGELNISTAQIIPDHHS